MDNRKTHQHQLAALIIGYVLLDLVRDVLGHHRPEHISSTTEEQEQSY
jgi:hypothetical protein